MNHRSSGSLVLSKAITGFINYKTAEGLTFRSVDSYERVLERWAEHIGEIDIGRITHQSISDYLLFRHTLLGNHPTLCLPSMQSLVRH
jgi:integrase/recombinase XerD